MKALSWVLIGAGVVVAVVFLIANAPEPAYSTGDPDVDRFADKTDLWGGKQRVKGTGGSLLGKAKQGFGEVTGNEQLANEGAADQAVGAVKDAAGKVAGAVSDTVRDLNQ